MGLMQQLSPNFMKFASHGMLANYTNQPPCNIIRQPFFESVGHSASTMDHISYPTIRLNSAQE